MAVNIYTENVIDEYLVTASDLNISISDDPKLIKCAYCGSPNDQMNCMCSQCGAPLPLEKEE